MLNTKQQATFAKLTAGHGMLVPSIAQKCVHVGFNQDGDAIIARTFTASPNRQYRYLVNAAGKILNRPQ